MSRVVAPRRRARGLPAAGCSLMTPSCFVGRPGAVWELGLAAVLGVGLHLAQSATTGAARTLLMPVLLLLTSLLFQLL